VTEYRSFLGLIFILQEITSKGDYVRYSVDRALALLCSTVRRMVFVLLHGNAFNDPDVISERPDRHAVTP
jgi:hypothetical protein